MGGRLLGWGFAGSCFVLSACGRIAEDPAPDAAPPGANGGAGGAAGEVVMGSDVVDSGDLPVEPFDASVHDDPDSGFDAQAEAGLDAGSDDAARDPACPSSYMAANSLACRAIGTSCRYPEGTCTCAPTACVGWCHPLTCLDVGATCGLIGDGCGQAIQCGSCTAPEVCGGGGEPNVCGGGYGSPPDGGAHAPDGGPGCVHHGCPVGACGMGKDGCGQPLDCGPCTSWQCQPLPPECPSAAPIGSGTPCAHEGLSCLYTAACCVQEVKCQNGQWNPGPKGCAG